MHPNAHLHRELARDIHARRIAEAAALRDASIGAPGRRQMAPSRETPAQSLFARLVSVRLRHGH